MITLAESRKVNPSEKEIIGRVAADLIRNGDAIMIDGGFTTYQIARNIQASDIKVVTNSIDVVQALGARKDVSVVVLGGCLLTESGTTVGSATERQIRKLSADTAFLGANAISPGFGLSADHESTAGTKQAMIQCCRKIVVVADHSKLGRTALYNVAPIESIDTLITDDKADAAIVKKFRAAGIEVIVASDA